MAKLPSLASGMSIEAEDLVERGAEDLVERGADDLVERGADDLVERGAELLTKLVDLGRALAVENHTTMAVYVDPTEIVPLWVPAPGRLLAVFRPDGEPVDLDA